MLYTVSPTERYSVARLGQPDRDIDQAVLNLALPNGTEMVHSDNTGLSSGSHNTLILADIPWVFKRAITENDITFYTKQGTRYGKLNIDTAFLLWNAVLNIVNFILAAAQPEVSDSRDLMTAIPYITLNALQFSFPQLLFLKRHSGTNPFFAEDDMPVTKLVQLYHDLQYGGRVTLKWIMESTERCIYRDVMGRWDWDHWRMLQDQKVDLDLASVDSFLVQRGFAAKVSRAYYFAGLDVKELVSQTPATSSLTTDFTVAGSAPSDHPNYHSRTMYGNPIREMVLHPEVSSYCRAHPNFNPFAISADPFNPIDASYDNTDALLGLPPAVPPPTPTSSINNPDPSAHCLAGYARSESAFTLASLPDSDSDIEMVDAESESGEAREVDAEEMTAWMQKLHLESHYSKDHSRK
ncbi:hypothetical protein C8R43DRAFT_958512 [Mycena crocata]|nr:hypothetical protein C8R43DRAFT_958512 [Mycena crocata]